jgi:DNA helicase IV
VNFNDNPEKLKREEQVVLDDLISRMDCVLESLDKQMKKYVAEAKNADISINPDLYLSKILAQKGIKDTAENRKKLLQSRDELYKTRLLLQYEDENGECGVEEVKVGLHSCTYGSEQFVISWYMPLCSHYFLDNASVEYESVVKDKRGREYHTNYKLLAKNQVELRFTHVKKALNLFPGIFDDKTLEMMKGKGFVSDAYLDEMIKRFNPDEYDPDAAAKIISDEFLQELLERRNTQEFKNIVFSIQKKQGEIIQAPYNRNMVVQGCAGSGKSMIMLHRLPILLYDNSDNLGRNNLYVITPSQMYIQLADNMRHQLEISDINMGTIEEYYDYCIAKYARHKADEYGKINHGLKIGSDNEKYIYSQQCINDIKAYFDSMVSDGVSLDKAYSIFTIKENDERPTDTYSQKIRNRSLKLQNVMNANNAVVAKYFKGIKDTLAALHSLSITLQNRKNAVIREITKQITKTKENIAKAKKELEKLNPEENSVAVENRNNTIEMSEKRIEQLWLELSDVKADEEYFSTLINLNEKIESVREPFAGLKNEFSQNTVKDIYNVIDKTGQLIGGFFMLSWEFSRLEDKYTAYLGAISKDVDKARICVSDLQGITEKYLDFDYYNRIREEREELTNVSSNAIKNAYKLIMGNVGIEPAENGNMQAIKCSPYIYLQILYCYYGAPSSKEALLAIDEAQGISPEEIRLLKNVNSNKVIFNMYGDVYQHIEGTKGIDSWDEFKDIVDFDYYEMLENYRNASQITEYCNSELGMNMKPINTTGKGVHELKTEDDFRSEMITQLMDTQRNGLGAILVSNAAEARSFMDKLPMYENKFHDMTDEDFDIHRTRWNIISIDDAKGLEFSSVIVLSGRMSRNERYIAFTRALDDLYIYPNLLDITGFEKKSVDKRDEESAEENGRSIANVVTLAEKDKPKHGTEKSEKNYADSAVRRFFEDNGLEVVDNRERGGRLWVVGEKSAIRNIVNAALAKFGISGKYATEKDIKNKNGWCTKTDK